MKTIKILTAILSIIIIGSLIWAATLPNELHIKQSIKIKAPIGVVFNEINDLHNWNHWSPWKDTTLSAKFLGATKGVGAKVIWTDKKEGEATLSIIEVEHFSKIITEMTVPNKTDLAQMEFNFKIEGDSVEVIWSRDINELSYPFGRFVGWMLEKGYEHNFKRSLKSLKNYIEIQKGEAEYYGYEIIENTFDGGQFLASNTSSTMDDMAKEMAARFGAIMKLAAEHQLEPLGPPMVQWHTYHPEATSEFTCMLPLQLDSAIAAKNVYSMDFPKTKTIMLRYVGPYEGSYNAWMALDNYMAYNSLIINGDPWEEYVIGPANEPDSTQWITQIYFPVK